MSGVDERSSLSLAREQARAQGRQEGRQESLRALRAVLSELLRQRGLTPIPEEQARLEGCEDLETLQRWFVQAMSATSVSDALR